MSTLATTSFDDDDDLKCNNSLSTIIEEYYDNYPESDEVRNNLEDVAGDISSDDDDESSLSGDDNYQRQNVLRNHLDSIIDPNDDRYGRQKNNKKLNGQSDLLLDDTEEIAYVNYKLDIGNGELNCGHLSCSEASHPPFDDDDLKCNQSASTIIYDSYAESDEVRNNLEDVAGAGDISSDDDESRLELYETRGRDIDDLKNQLELIKKSSNMSCNKLSNALKVSNNMLKIISLNEKQLKEKLTILQNKYDLTKQNLDSLNLVNNMKLYEATLPAEHSVDHLNFIQDLDFNNLSSMEKKNPAIQSSSDKSAANLEFMLKDKEIGLQKLREENLNLQKVIIDKNTEIKKFQNLIKQQSESCLNSPKKEITDNSLIKADDKLAGEIVIGKFQTILEKEKLHNYKLQKFFQELIKTQITTSAIDRKEAEISNLKGTIHQCVKELITLKLDTQLQLIRYEDKIKLLTDTLIEKESEIKEVKFKLQTHEVMVTLHSGISNNDEKLRESNKILKKQLSSVKEVMKEKLTENHEKYKGLKGSLKKYRKKPTSRIKECYDLPQRIGIQLDEDNVKFSVRNWLNLSRCNIIETIDTNCKKLNEAPTSYLPNKYHLKVLLTIKKLVLKLVLKDSDIHYFNIK